MRVLLSGMALAEASNRRFSMLWPNTSACGAGFHDLFQNQWPVKTVTAGAVKGLPYVSGWFGQLPDILTSTKPHLVVGHPTWLFPPHLSPVHERLMARCAELMGRLRPVSPIQQSVDRFKESAFRKKMIGVHARRGDFISERPDLADNLTELTKQTDAFLEQDPSAGIFFATDDGAFSTKLFHPRFRDIRECFSKRYGNRLVFCRPRSLNRQSALAVQDALKDFLLLRSTDYFVGTAQSSFSEMIPFGRTIPNVFCSGPVEHYMRIEKLCRMVGLYDPITQWGRRRFNRTIPFAVLLRYCFNSPRRFVGRISRMTAYGHRGDGDFGDQ